MAEETSEQILVRLKARLEKVQRDIVAATLARESGKITEEAYEKQVEPMHTEEQILTKEMGAVSQPSEDNLPLSFMPLRGGAEKEQLPIGMLPLEEGVQEGEPMPIGLLPLKEKSFGNEQLPLSFLPITGAEKTEKEQLPMSFMGPIGEASKEHLPLSFIPLKKEEKPPQPQPILESLISFKVALEELKDDFDVQGVEYSAGFDSQFSALQQQATEELKKIKAWAVGRVDDDVLHLEKMVTTKEEVDMAARGGLEEAIEWTFEPREPLGYFHAGYPKNIPSVMENGLLPGDFVMGTDQYGRRLILDRGVFFADHPGAAAMYAACRYQLSVPPYEPFFMRGWQTLRRGELWAILEIRRYAELDKYMVAMADEWSSGGSILQMTVPPSRISHIYLNKRFQNEYFMAVPELERYKDMIVWCESEKEPQWSPREEDLFRTVAGVHGLTVKQLEKQIEERRLSLEPRRKPRSGLPPFLVVMPENGYSCMVGDFTGTYVDVLNHMAATGHRCEAKGFAKFPTAFGKMVFEKLSDVSCTSGSHRTARTESGILLCINCNRLFLPGPTGEQTTGISVEKAKGAAEA